MSTVQIASRNITVKELDGQRVVTLKDIDDLHNRTEGTAGRNFRENRHRFIPGTDYYDISPERFQSDEIRRFGISSPRGGMVFTESGYLMLVKSLMDDLAWEVQRQLVNNYFRRAEAGRVGGHYLLEATKNLLNHQEIMAERLGDVERRLDEEITLTSGQQRTLQQAVAKRVCGIEPEKDERGPLFRQLYREIKDRWQVASYKDVRKIDLQDALAYVAAWVPIRREGA